MLRSRIPSVILFLLMILAGCAFSPPVPTTSTPTLMPPQPTSDGRNPKKGALLVSSNCEDIDTLQVNWYFNNNFEPQCVSSTAKFVPRLFSIDQVADDAILEQALENAKDSGWLVGFVEPNLPWHGNVSPENGAKAWRAVEEAALPLHIKLVAPGPSQHAPNTKILPEYAPDPYGYTWLWAMIDAYQELYDDKPHFDAIAWNFYENNPDATKDFLIDRHEESLALGYDVPFWVMEYAGRCWDTDRYPTGNDLIMSEVTPWFNDTPWIGRYAWFANRIRGDEAWGPNHHSCSLINPENGQPTALGQRYREY